MPWLKILARDKRSSLLWRNITDDEKRFIATAPDESRGDEIFRGKTENEDGK
jgi:hypothetical protein